MSDTSKLVNSEVVPHGERSVADGAPAGSETNEYVEFFSGTVPCPSCKGLGRIPKELEHQMVAIIPLSDKRLKPSRAHIWVILAVVICLIIGGLCLFFFLPRSVSVNNTQKLIKPFNAIVNSTQDYVFLDVKMEFNISNTNYYPVTVTSFYVYTIFDQKVIGQNTNTSHVMIPMRTTKVYSVDLQITFEGDEGYIAYYCSGSPVVTHSLLLPIYTVAKIEYMGHTEENTLTLYKHIECSAKRLMLGIADE